MFFFSGLGNIQVLKVMLFKWFGFIFYYLFVIAAELKRIVILGVMLDFAVLEGLKYASSHEWVKHEGSVATIGITDHAQVNNK